MKDLTRYWRSWKAVCSQDFHQNWDESKVRSFIEGCLKGQVNARAIGTGSTFSTYALTCGAFDYAISIPNNKTVDQENPNMKFWQVPQNLERVRSLTLIPPFRVLFLNKLMTIVTPLGESGSSQIQQTDELIRICKTELASARLIYDDMIQTRVKDTMPFLIDLTSIRPAS